MVRLTLVVASVVAVVSIFFVAQKDGFQRESKPTIQSSTLNQTNDTGPQAAFDLYEEYVDPPQPIPLERMKNIIQLTFDCWRRGDVLEMFKTRREQEDQQKKEPPKVGYVVMLKTEECHDDERFCAAMTAALEKASSPWISYFTIFGMQVPADPIYLNPITRQRNPYHGESWRPERTIYDKIKNEYQFVQGPGARIVVFAADGTEIGATNARDMGLLGTTFANNHGRTPRLDSFFKAMVERAKAR